MSELSYKQEVLRRMINVDETHHKKSTEGDKGGSRKETLTNPDLPRGGSRFCKDNGDHVSGCYGSNVLEPKYATSRHLQKHGKGSQEKEGPSGVGDGPSEGGRSVGLRRVGVDGHPLRVPSQREHGRAVVHADDCVLRVAVS